MKLIRTFVKEIESNAEKLMKVSRRKWLLSVVEDRLQDNPNILELGVGSGVIPYYLHKKGYGFFYMGLDKKVRQLKISAKLFKKNNMKNAHSTYCDFDGELFIQSTFDQVWFVGGWVRGFTATYDHVFKEAHRVLKPDGLFIFDAPGMDEIREKYYHRRLSRKDIDYLLKNLFTIVSIEQYERKGIEERKQGTDERTDETYHYWGVVCKKI